MTEHLTFDKLPEAVTLLTKEVSELKRLLIEKQEQAPTEHPEELLTIQEAAELLSLTVSTMYSKVSKGELPVMKQGKRLYFSRTELLDSVKSNRKKKDVEVAVKKGISNKRRSHLHRIEKRYAIDCTTALHKKRRINTGLQNQLKTMFQYLQENTATASMVAEATGIPQKNICRYKRKLQLAGKLWGIERKSCCLTGFNAWYLTTDPNKG